MTMTRPRNVLFASTVLLTMTVLPAQANTPVTSGEKVYQQFCAACHATGVAGAPKAGDQAAWKPLLAEGQATLTGHGWVGVRAMPAQGGATALSLEAFSRAVAWMARQSGGNWPDPDASTLQAIRKEAQLQLKKDMAAKQKKLAEPSR